MQTDAVKQSLKKSRLPVLFSILFSTAIVLQRKVGFHDGIHQAYADNLWIPFRLSDALVFLLVFLAGMALFLTASKWIGDERVRSWILSERAREYTLQQKAVWWMAFSVALFLPWLFFFLMDYPGSVGADGLSIMAQSTGEMGFSNHHPVVYTLFVMLFVQIGRHLFSSFQIGVALYSLTQMMIISGILGFIMMRMKMHGVRTYILTLAWGYYCCNSLFAIYSFTMWKDPLFSAFLYLLIWQLFELTASRGGAFSDKSFCVSFTMLSLLIVFFRNNGIYIIVPLLVILLFFYRRERRVIAKCAVIIMSVVFLVRIPVFHALNVYSDHAEESLGIPLQQMAYTLRTEGELEGADVLYKVMPKTDWQARYHPFNADYLKWNDVVDLGEFNRSSGEILSVWFRNLPGNLLPYVRAYLTATYGFWSFGTWDDYGYYDLQVHRENRWELHAVDLLQKAGLPDWRFLNQYTMHISSGTLIWVMLFVSFLLLYTGNRRKLLSLIPAILLWGTIMIATPVAFSLRYVFVLVYALPFLLVLPFIKEVTVR